MSKVKIENKKQKTNKTRKMCWTRLSLLLLLVVLLVVGVYKLSMKGVSYYKESISAEVLSDKDILNQLKTHIEIPKEDVVRISKVRDSEALEKESKFYEGVQKGYYIIIYPSLAIMYDQKNDRIVRTMKIEE